MGRGGGGGVGVAELYNLHKKRGGEARPQPFPGPDCVIYFVGLNNSIYEMQGKEKSWSNQA